MASYYFRQDNLNEGLLDASMKREFLLFLVMLILKKKPTVTIIKMR